MQHHSLGSLFLAISSICLFSIPAAHAITVDDVSTQIQSSDIRSVQSFFEHVGVSPFDLIAIVQSSASLQAVVPATATSSLMPRVILSDKNANFVIGFNGAGSMLGSGSLDIFELDPSTLTYIPSVVEFDPAGIAPVKSISKNVPQACASCHFPLIGSEPHPGFLTLPLAPSIFGSVNGTLTVDEKKSLQAFVQSPSYPAQYGIVGQFIKKSGLPLDQVGASAKEMGRQITENLYSGFALALSKNAQFKPFRYAFLAALTCSDFTPEKYISSSALAQLTLKLADENTALAGYRNSQFTQAQTLWTKLNPSSSLASTLISDENAGDSENNFNYLAANLLTVKNGFPKNYDWFSSTIATESDTNRLKNLSVYLAQYTLTETEDQKLASVFSIQSQARTSRVDIFTLGNFEKETCDTLSTLALKSF